MSGTLIKILYIVCAVASCYGAKQISVFQNFQKIETIECLETDFSKLNFETIENNTIIYFSVEDACDHTRPISQLQNFTGQFIALAEMGKCTHLQKTLELQKRGASAVFIISYEDSIGMLVALLDDYTYNYPDIPSAQITRKDGRHLKDLAASENVTVQFQSSSDRALQHGWKTYIPLFFVLFFVESLGWILCLLHLHYKPNTTASRILCGVGLFQCLWHCFDLIFDHWNLRGFISLAAEQVIYGIGIGPIFLNVYLFCWLWYCIIDEKRNIKKGSIDPQYRLLPFVVLPQVILEVTKFALVGSGSNATEAWRRYNVVNSAILALGVGVFGFVGYRLRKTIKKILTDKNNNQHRFIGWVTYISVANMWGAVISLYLWVFHPTVFGISSFFIFNTFWRTATVLENAIQMLLFLPKSWESCKEVLTQSSSRLRKHTSMTLPSLNSRGSGHTELAPSRSPSMNV